MIGSTLRAATAAAVAAVALAGCFVPMEKGRQMEARIQRLEVQSVEQQQGADEQRAAFRERMERIDQSLRAVQVKIDELNQAARRSGADLGVTLNRLQDEFAKLKGEVEVTQHQIAELDKSVGTLRSDADARFAALKGQGAMDAYDARQKIASLPRQDDKAAFYALAQREEDQGDKGVARELWEEYVRRWPTDPRSAEAGFRAGDLLTGQKRYREALLAYGRVAESFPRSERAPPSLLGAAESMVRLEMRDDAVTILKQLVEKYPKSDAAAKARTRLKELAPPPPPEKKPDRKAEKPKAKPSKKPTARK